MHDQFAQEESPHLKGSRMSINSGGVPSSWGDSPLEDKSRLVSSPRIPRVLLWRMIYIYIYIYIWIVIPVSADKRRSFYTSWPCNPAAGTAVQPLVDAPKATFQCPYEDFTRLAETRLAQNTLTYINTT